MTTKVYRPQLDGVRGLAIAAVIAYHLGDLPGGWLGVDVFFVLSGYLITSILMTGNHAVWSFPVFWGRRARRLFPAVLLLLLVLAAYTWAGGPGVVPAQLRSPALATLFYFANWQQIAANHSYFQQYTLPSPLVHTWSLAIEEQYYVVWPPLLAMLVWVSHRRRQVLASLILLLAATSAIWMGVAAHLYGPNRAYLGTDTRAWELLLGGALAIIWPSGSSGDPATSGDPPAGRRPWAIAGVVGAAGVAAGIATAGGPPAWIWDGGLVAISCGAGLVIVGSVRAPFGPASRVLSLRPLRWVGLISYSLYLWHWPVIVLMTQTSTGLYGADLLGARLAAMLAVSVFSYYLVERPLRRYDWGSLGRRLHAPVPTFAGVGVVVVAVVLVASTTGPAAAKSAEVTSAGPNVAAPPDEATLDVPRASPSDPYRVWILGDSVMSDASIGVQAALQATGKVKVVENTAFPGWGLTRIHNFPTEVTQAVAASHPQIVIGTWSWDDQVAEADPGGYVRQLEGAMRVLLAHGDGVSAVVLIQFPQVGPALALTDPAEQTAAWRKETAAQDAWDRDAQRAVEAFPGHALYLTTDQLFAPGGRFYTWFKTPAGTWVRARKEDNTHFCPYGAAEWGALTTNELTVDLKLPPMKPGWEFGKWTHDPRYNQPAGACPDDQPPPGYHGIAVPEVPDPG